MATKTHKINDGTIVKLIKSGTSIPKAAAQCGTGTKEMALAYYRLEPVADTSLVITGTKAQVAKQIVAGRKAGLRWERLVARTGMKLVDVKSAYTASAGTDADLSYCGRGRHFELTRANSPKRPARKAVAAKKPAAKKGNTRKSTPKQTAAKRPTRKPTAR